MYCPQADHGPFQRIWYSLDDTNTVETRAARTDNYSILLVFEFNASRGLLLGRVGCSWDCSAARHTASVGSWGIGGI